MNQFWELSSSLNRSDRLLERVSIALVGKYTKLSDSYASVIKALEHSALAINHKLEVKVCCCHCFIVVLEQYEHLYLQFFFFFLAPCNAVCCCCFST